MLRVLDCLRLDHDPYLVLLAAAICCFGTIASMVVATRAMRGEHATLWMALLAICAGSSVWATHFLAMLAYRTAIPMTYDASLTLASYLLGVALMGAGLRVALRAPDDAHAAVLGGAIVGAGVTTLHYVGMAALRVPGQLHYSPEIVIASVTASSLLGGAALYVGLCSHRPRAVGFSALLLIAMTVTLHFTGMGAVRLELGYDVDAGAGMSRGVLAVAVSLAAIGVLLIGAVAAIVDQRVSRRLAGEAERFRTLADGAMEGLIVHRDGLVVDMNAAARAMFAFEGGGAALCIRHWFEDLEPEAAEILRSSDGRAVELALPRQDGSRFPAEICARHMRLADGGDGELLAIRDLTVRKATEARIEHLAWHDPLTDLPNRRLFLELANKAIAQVARGGQHLAVLAIDLDGFKLVNDVHGHAAGDSLLKQVAARIAATLRDADVAARFGGDEFAILQSLASQPEQAMCLAERLLDLLAAPLYIGGVEVTVSASIGVALYPTDGRTTDELLRNADTAMYRAKADGKATCRFFEAQMDAEVETRRRLEARLRQAVADERLQVFFQPLVGSGDHRPLGFEALVRWHDAELGNISPADFIPVAEQTGLIVAIGEQVLRRACREAAGWSAPLRVAVNLSAVQFRRKGLVDMVRGVLEDTGLPGERLELEVTESLLIDNRDEALRTLTALKALGVRIAMDDFGTGYSSLSYLQSFPFDKIKIDRVFVADLERGEQNASIVRAVASMGQSLRMRVVAEGVESAAQAHLLRDLSCDELQGYYIARPMPAEAVEDFLLGHVAPAAPATVVDLRRATR
ncbi:MAG: EAL domain-containing protein [Gammaproteobacteria bacterium]